MEANVKLQLHQGALLGETKRKYIRGLRCAMPGYLQKATIALLHCGVKPQNYSLVLACFSLTCNLGAISLSRVVFHMESEKHAVLTPPLKVPELRLVICHQSQAIRTGKTLQSAADFNMDQTQQIGMTVRMCCTAKGT